MKGKCSQVKATIKRRKRKPIDQVYFMSLQSKLANYNFRNKLYYVYILYCKIPKLKSHER